VRSRKGASRAALLARGEARRGRLEEPLSNHAAAASPALPAQQPQNDQLDYRADEGIDHCGDETATYDDADPRQQPAGDDGLSACKVKLFR